MTNDRNQVVIRLYFGECQFICPQISIFQRAEKTDVAQGVLNGFTLSIPRRRFVCAPHRVHFRYTSSYLCDIVSPNGCCYYLFEQAVPLSDRDKQLALEADMVDYFDALTFRVPKPPRELATFRW